METFCWNSRVFEPGVMKEISALVQPAAKPFNIIKPRIHPICAIFSFFFCLSAFFIYHFMYSVGFIVFWPFALLGAAVSPKQNPSSIMVKTEVNFWTHKGCAGSKLNKNKKTIQFKLLSSYIHHFWFYSLGNYTCRFNHVQKHLPGWDWSHNL